MSRFSMMMRWVWLFMAASLVAVGLAACGGGDDGDTGPAGPPGTSGTSTTSSAASLDITIDSVTISSPPVVELTVDNEDGIPFDSIGDGDLSFTIAKLVPAAGGNPSYWQSYINREETATVGPGTGNTAVQANRESNGTLVNHGDGTYTYTFATDITNVTTPLAVSYEPTLTHRVAIQIGGGLPVSNPIYTFRPSDNATTGIVTRDIVKIENCNECHNKLALHGSGRVDTRYCVTCHNPGSTDANSGNTVDFKVMIHKIHRGEDLPSVDAGGEYSIYGFRDTKHDYSDVALPQDIRNCTKCHDGSDPDTPDGDNWKTQLSIESCGSCHDDVDFSKDGSDAGANDPDGHEGGIVSDNTECITCHATGRIARSVEETHVIPERVAAAKFQFNIISVTGAATPVIEFSVTDPTNADAEYLIGAGDATSNPTFMTPGASRMAILVGWDTVDFNNDGSGSNPGLPISINPIDACDGTPIADWSCTETGGVYTLTKLSALAAGATGTGRVAIEGHPAADDGTGAYTLRVPVTSVVKDFVITGTLTARRDVVSIAKCDQCHEQVGLHGSNRNDEPQLCVMCHNPNATDVNRRPKDGAGAPDPDPLLTLDGKKEEAIDFKRLIHGIHAAAETNYDDTEAHGFREQGLVVFGFGGSRHDFSHVRFPGILQDCETCHLEGTYELEDNWELPTANGILSSTVNSAPFATDAASLATGTADQTDDLNISPTAAVCSACHDSVVAKAHMEVPGGAVFDQTQAVIDGVVIETCSVCHGPGRDADVEEVHAAR